MSSATVPAPSPAGLVIDGCEFPAGAGEIESNLWMCFQGERKKGGLITKDDRFRYLKRAIDLTFNVPGSIRRVVWNEWTEDILRDCITEKGEKNFIGFAGCSSCVSGDTRILDPTTWEQPTIQSLAENGIEPWVMTLDGPVKAEVPYLKGKAEMLEIKLSNGQKFKCTLDHRILTAQGWKPTHEASVGELILGYVPSLPGSIEDSDLQDQPQDALHCSETTGGSQFDYSAYFHPCDEQLQLAKDAAQGILPSLAGARTRSGCASGHSDAPCSGSKCSRPYPRYDLSKRNASPRNEGILETLWLRLRVGGIFSPHVPPSQQQRRFAVKKLLHRTFSEPVRYSYHKLQEAWSSCLDVVLRRPAYLGYALPFSPTFQPRLQPDECSSAFQTVQEPVDCVPGFSPNPYSDVSSALMVAEVEVLSITNLGVCEFYDLHVPGHEHYFAEGAIHHNSGKSDAVALYGLMGYWARPSETFFIVMSTTKQDARMRVWKSVTQLWGQAEIMGCPGKLIDSDGYIKGVDANGKLWRNSGIVLKAAGKADGEEASKELLGIKNPHVIVAADEKNELHPGILKTASENLISNETLTFAGMANPDKLTDPFGDLCEPEDGWKSINDAQTAWRTKYGKCRRFNAEDSPRIKHPELVDARGRHLFHWQPDQAYCDRIAKQRGGKKSRGYYRFVKAFWCPDGSANSIYSEIEFLNSCALDQTEPAWDDYPEILESLDPSFSRGGDRSQAAFAKLGKVKGRDHLHVCLETTIEDDITDKTVPPTHQVIRKWRDLGIQWGVKPCDAIHDNTGAGTPFGDVISAEWSPAVQRVNFNGKASDRVVLFRDENCQYFNKNSELWIQPAEFIRSNQISGLSKETMGELVEREYHPKEGRTVRVEGKDEAKKRLKKSPDRADAFLLLVEKAVTKGKFRSEEVKKVTKTVNSGWDKVKQKKSLSSTCGRRLRR